MRFEPDDVAINKATTIGRCVARIQEEYRADPELKDQTRVDALTLNVERACQAAIDLAYHAVSQLRLGMPQSSADAFSLLAKQGLVSKQNAAAMVAMTGFRNVAIHEYQELDPAVLRAVAETRWHGLVDFCADLGLRVPLPPAG